MVVDGESEEEYEGGEKGREMVEGGGRMDKGKEEKERRIESKKIEARR